MYFLFGQWLPGSEERGNLNKPAQLLLEAVSTHTAFANPCNNFEHNCSWANIYKPPANGIF